MTYQRVSAAALALALAASQVPSAWAAAPDADSAKKSYQTALFLNGERLDTSAIPNAEDAALVPMRLIAESDNGYAQWFEEENQGFFSLDGATFIVNFADNSVELNGEKLDEVTACVVDGVTFLSAAVFADLKDYAVSLDPAQETARIDLATPNGRPLTKLARQIIGEINMACSMKNSQEEMKEYLGIDADKYDEVVCFSSMMVRADALVIGKLAEGADKEEAKAELEERRAAIERSFEHYLPDPYEMAQNGQVVECGEYLMLVISEDNDRAVELFRAAVSAGEEEK